MTHKLLHMHMAALTAASGIVYTRPDSFIGGALVNFENDIARGPADGGHSIGGMALTTKTKTLGHDGTLACGTVPVGCNLKTATRQKFDESHAGGMGKIDPGETGWSHRNASAIVIDPSALSAAGVPLALVG